MTTNDMGPLLESIVENFERRSGLRGLDHVILARPNPVAVIHVANPTERLYALLEEVTQETKSTDSDEAPIVTLKRQVAPNLLEAPEGKLLLRTLSESLNINRHSFQDDFFSRYTKSVLSAEEQITAAANHVVFGRRGAGKSSLLLYALHTRSQEGRPSAWVDMQVYARRADQAVVVEVLREIIEQSATDLPAATLNGILQELAALRTVPDVDEAKIRNLLPDIRRLFSGIAAQHSDLAIFIDDLHVIAPELQPKLLASLYAVSRGNNVFLKLSAIETFTKLWDSEAREGLEIPHDVQEVKLDYNLTTPDKATAHIESILDAHAWYCALPSVRRLCTSADVIPRLVWVAAGVPRDALNLFAQAMTKATLDGRKLVSVSNVNVAASEAVTSKLRDLATDASAEAAELQERLDAVVDFCVKEQRKNAFLLQIKGDEKTSRLMNKLVDLRLLHVISEGISVGEAGSRYLALILDYGFYIGIRAARSVDLFNKQTKRVPYKDLRVLPRLVVNA